MVSAYERSHIGSQSLATWQHVLYAGSCVLHVTPILRAGPASCGKDRGRYFTSDSGNPRYLLSREEFIPPTPANGTQLATGTLDSLNDSSLRKRGRESF